MRYKEIRRYPTDFVLYVGPEAVQKYSDRREAEKAKAMLQAKFPHRLIKVHEVECIDRELEESRILPANQLVTVYVHGQDNKGHVIRHPVVKNFPHKDVDQLIDYLVKVKKLNPKALYWEAGSQFNESELDELIQPEIKQQQGFTKSYTDELGLIWTAHSRGEFDLTVDVQSPHQGQIAYITLEVNPDEETMSSQDTWVDKKWRRMGIGTKMYNWAEELGNTVVDSSTLSAMGKKFWKARKAKRANQSSE